MPFNGGNFTETPAAHSLFQAELAVTGMGDSDASYAAAAAGSGAAFVPFAGGNAGAGYNATPQPTYQQELWTVKLDELRNLSTLVDGVPKPSTWGTAHVDPRYDGYVWSVPPAPSTVRFSPKLQHHAKPAAGGGDLAAVVAHGWSLTNFTGAVTLNGLGNGQCPYVPVGSLPAADYVAAPPSTSYAAGGGVGEYQTAAYYPLLNGGQGAHVPNSAWSDLTVHQCYVLLVSEWQRISDGPPAGEYLYNTTSSANPELYVAFAAGTFHYVWFSGPTQPAGVTLDATGHCAWLAASTDQPGDAIVGYRLELWDVTNISSQFMVSGHDLGVVTSFTLTDTLLPGHTYTILVAAKDSIGYSAEDAGSFTINTDPNWGFSDNLVIPSGPNGDPKIDLTGSMLAQFRAAVSVFGARSTDPDPLP